MDDEAIYKDSIEIQKIRSYSIDFKLKAVEYAEINNIKAAANKFNIDRKRIRVGANQRFIVIFERKTNWC